MTSTCMFADNQGMDSNRPGTLLLRVGELRRACVEHMEIAICSQKDNPDVDFSELWKEMFLNMAGEGFKPRGVCKKRLQMSLAAAGQASGAVHNPLGAGPTFCQEACQRPDTGPHLDKSMLPGGPNT